MNTARFASALPWVPLLPLLGFLVNGLLGRRLPRTASAAVACAGPLLSCLLSFLAFLQLDSPHAFIECRLGDWITVGDLSIPFALRVDRLSAIMLLVVTGVGSLIHIYSIEYMGHDRGFARYFAYLNLFLSAMLLLVMAENLVLLFVGWEGVGLCSYLLIGFWFEDVEKARAGKKAFLVNRIGDFGFLLGLFLLFRTCGTLDIPSILHWLRLHELEGGLALTITLLLFVGATGKSAQIPLYVWLPDAMAGPTPVSALIHAATMVTAGVYMVARLSPLFFQSQATLFVIAVVGALTAVVAAFYALTQNDIKKVLAYSTISQLGYMFLGLGASAYAGAVFHLFTHAFFKALLFLGAGAVIHALDDEQDLRKMGGLGKKLGLTFAAMAVGSLALSGIPPFAGFASKDLILWSVLEAGLTRNPAWLLLWVIGLVTAFMTAFYSMRLVGMAFFGEYRGPEETWKKADDPKLAMGLPLVALIGGSFAAGIFGWPHLLLGHEEFVHYLEPVVAPAPLQGHGEHHLAEWLNLLLSVGAGFGGIALGYRLYVQSPLLPAALLQRSAHLRQAYELSFHKLYVDELYDRYVVQPLHIGAEWAWEMCDTLWIDGTCEGIARQVMDVGASLRRTQTGVVSIYAVSMLVGGIVMLGWAVVLTL
ncbi:MAG: NADH-quinone oxidoreductase subunit L [Planctomycetes bacterium]|nr:NADH-quinone oxidoreductase subunit L [Planctomycetota bacterium]